MLIPPLKQPRLILQESEPFIPYKALLIVLSSMVHTAAMSCTAALGLRYTLNCTIFDATVAPVFSPDDTITRYGNPFLYSRFHSSTLW